MFPVLEPQSKKRSVIWMYTLNIISNMVLLQGFLLLWPIPTLNLLYWSTLALELLQTQSPDCLCLSDEATDTDDNEEEELGVLDDQRSIIIHLLSQLKLGMDLTRVSPGLDLV